MMLKNYFGGLKSYCEYAKSNPFFKRYILKDLWVNDISDIYQNDVSYEMIWQTFVSKLYKRGEGR